MLRSGISILILSACLICQAQNDTILKNRQNGINFKLSYNCSILYPGISTGVEIPLKSSTARETDLSLDNHKAHHQMFISGNLSWYHQQDYHDNIYLTAEWITRRTRKGGLLTEFSAGTGVSRTFLSGETYSVSSSGNVSLVREAGYYYAVVLSGYGIGYDLFKGKEIPLSFFSKLNLLVMFPYNSTIYFRPVLDIGLIWSPGESKSGLKGNYK